MVVDFVTPFRDRTLELLEDAQLDAILRDEAARATPWPSAPSPTSTTGSGSCPRRSPALAAPDGDR